MDREPTGFDGFFQTVSRDVDPRKLKRFGRIVTLMMILIVLVTVAMSMVVPYVEYLWFRYDVRQVGVFTRAYQARSLLLVVSFVIGWAVLYTSLRRALGLTLVFLKAPENIGQVLISNALGFVQTRGGSLVRFAAPVLAFLSALTFSGEWNTYLLAGHSQPFGVKDPTFGLDVSFFVFTLPWRLAMANFAVGLLLLTTIATTGIYAGIQAMAAMAKIELGRPGIRLHVHILIGLTLIAYAIQTWLRLYEIGLVDSAQFTGGGYAAVQGLGASRILAMLLGAAGLGTLINGRFGFPFRVPVTGGVLVGLWFFGGVIVYPTVVQRLKVDPDRLGTESPFAAQAIRMTRFAYGLDKIEVRDAKPSVAPTNAEVRDSKVTLDNMRLWDPQVLRLALEGLQGIRPYYAFSDVDVDRYTIDGKPTMVMLSPRQLDLTGLEAGAQNWTNQRLRYTHGYGLVVCQIDAATADGMPVMLSKDVPQVSSPALPLAQPRIYYGDLRSPLDAAVDEYAVVDTGEPEFDYPSPDNSANHRWTGDRGIPVGNFVNRLALSVVLGDGNLLVSPKISPTSRLLMRRNVVSRSLRLYPFLTFDHDPYVVLLDGRLMYVLDGHTTTDMVPYSAMTSEGGPQLNYVRNSVKVVVDAYTGETNAYAVEPNEPIIRAYRAIYPGLVRDLSEAPAGLAAHFRYPDYLIGLQSRQLGAYHVTNPTVFLSNGDAWTLARQRGLRGEKEPIQPFFVEMRLPDEPTAGFVSILPFTPVGRVNMSGWLAAHCDPGSYGRVTLYRFGQSSPVAGPEQVEAKFTSTPEISNINRQFNNGQSEIIVGNLLTIPIGRSFMYVESLFLQPRTVGIQKVPRLTKVIMALNERVVVGDTYAEALRQLLGERPPEPDVTPETSTPTTTTREVPAEAEAALKLLDDADSALRRGDFARYGELQKQARARLRALAGK